MTGCSNGLKAGDDSCRSGIVGTLAPISAERLEQGRQLTEKFCTTCHGMQSETASGKSPDAWKATVDAMIGMGAEANDEQARIIADYLSHTFPLKK